MYPKPYSKCGICLPEVQKKIQSYQWREIISRKPYIISTLKILEQRKEEEFVLCDQHKRELSIYCNDEGCMKPICQLCLMKSHTGHKVVDRIEEHKTKLGVLRKCLSDSRLLENLKLRKSKESLEALENMKRNSMDKFDRMINNVKESIASSKRRNQLVQEELENVLEMETNLDETERANPKEIESVDKLLDEKTTNESLCYYLKYEAAAPEKDPHGKVIEAEICLPKSNSEIVSSINIPPDHYGGTPSCYPLNFAFASDSFQNV